MSQKQILNESLAIDEEWKRINNERELFKQIEAELDRDYDEYNALVRESNKKATNNTIESKRLKEMKPNMEAKETQLDERKRRLLYDIDEVNKRSRAFNDRGQKSGIAAKQIFTVQFSSNGQVLQPKPYAKGEPLPGSPPAGSFSSPKAQGGYPSGPGEVVSRSFGGTGAGGGGLKGGLLSQPSSDLAQEGRLIDQEWARVENEKGILSRSGKQLSAEFEKLNARISEVNEMKTDNRKQIAEVEAWGRHLEHEEELLVEEQRHLLYDIDLLNTRVRLYNDATKRTKLPPKPTLTFSYTFKDAELTPLPY